MKNFLMITGAGGFIGSSLVNYFSKKKVKVHAYFNNKIEKNLKKNIIYVKKNLKNLKKLIITSIQLFIVQHRHLHL